MSADDQSPDSAAPSQAPATVAAAAPAAVPDGGFDFFAALWNGAWLQFLPASLREPAARLVVLGVGALVSMFVFAPAADQRGEAYIESAFARTLAALAATRGLDSAISLAQSSEVSFSFGPGGSLGIGQALDPVNDLVEQYGSLLLTSTTALGTQRVAMQIGRALGWWLFVPSLTAIVGSSLVGGRSRRSLMGWGTRLFGLALFARLAIPTTAWIDSVVAEQFLESGYQQAAAAVTATTAEIEQVEQAEEMAAKNKGWLDRFNPVDYVGERARRLYETLSQVGESIVNLAIYFTISTIILPLGTLWVLSRLSSTLFSNRSPSEPVEKVIHDLFPLETPPKKPRFFGGVVRRIRRRARYPQPAHRLAGGASARALKQKKPRCAPRKQGPRGWER